MKVEWVPIDLVKPSPINPNKHPDEQIERLAKIIQYQGFRLPIVTDNNLVIHAGHGRLLAAKKLGLKEVPVSKQDFLTEEQAYAFMVSDNAIASWADLDLSAVNMQLPDMSPDFDLDLLGIDNFKVDPAEKGSNEKECPACGHKF